MVTIAINHSQSPATFVWPIDDNGHDLTLRAARDITGTLGYPKKMPGTSYGIPASRCIAGAKLHTIAGSTCSDCYALSFVIRKAAHSDGHAEGRITTRAMRAANDGFQDHTIVLLAFNCPTPH